MARYWPLLTPNTDRSRSFDVSGSGWMHLGRIGPEVARSCPLSRSRAPPWSPEIYLFWRPPVRSCLWACLSSRKIFYSVAFEKSSGKIQAKAHISWVTIPALPVARPGICRFQLNKIKIKSKSPTWWRYWSFLAESVRRGGCVDRGLQRGSFLKSLLCSCILIALTSAPIRARAKHKIPTLVRPYTSEP